MRPLTVVVCVKQVPDTTEVKVDPVTKTLQREGVPAILNPLDTFALEEGVLIKEATGGSVTVVSMGPPQAEIALRECLALGADRAILLSDRAFAGADTLATARTLAAAVKVLEPDIIFCGKQAIDGDTAQVGPGIAEEMGIPHVAYVRKLQIDDLGVGPNDDAVPSGDEYITVERLVEGGVEVIRTSLPALLTVLKDINTPRLPSLRARLRAKDAQVEVWTAAKMRLDPSITGLRGSPTEVIKIFPPPSRASGKMLTGDLGSMVGELAGKIVEVLAR